jgi:hypothetical protein
MSKEKLEAAQHFVAEAIEALCRCSDINTGTENLGTAIEFLGQTHKAIDRAMYCASSIQPPPPKVRGERSRG